MCDPKVFTQITTSSAFREDPFAIEFGPNLPTAMAGHCQLNIGNGSIFVYGGITTLIDAKYQEYNNSAYVWKDHLKTWIRIEKPSPCPNAVQPPEIMQQCALLSVTNKVVILTQNFNEFLYVQLALTWIQWNGTNYQSAPCHWVDLF